MATRPRNVNEALHLIDNAGTLPPDEAVEQMQAAVDFLNEQDDLPTEVQRIRRDAERFIQEQGADPAGSPDEMRERVGDVTDPEPMQGPQPGRLPPQMREPGGPPHQLRGDFFDEPAGDPDRQALEDALVQQGADPSDPGTQALLDEMMGEGGADPFIGVPQGHVAPGTPDPLREPVRVQRPGESERMGRPVYRESDTERPFGWSAGRIADMQDRLVKAGFLQKGEFTRGWYDGATGQAYAQSLGFANQRGLGVIETLDTLAAERQDMIDAQVEESLDAFEPQVELPPDPASLRNRAREALSAIGRRSADIDDDELDAMVQVMSGEFKRARDVEVEMQRRQHEAQVRTEMGEPTSAEFDDLEAIDPLARFDEWFQSDEGFGGEITTRETSEVVGQQGRVFDQGMDRMRSQVRQGGA